MAGGEKAVMTNEGALPDGLEPELAAEDAVQIPGLAFWDWDVPNDRLRWSDCLVTLYGVAGRPNALQDFLSVVHPDDRLRVEGEVRSFVAGGDTFEHEFRIVQTGGEVRHVIDRGAVRRAADGRALRLVGVNFDVTEQRMLRERQDALSAAAQSALRISEDRLVRASEAAGFGTHDFSIADQAATWSEPLKRLMGVEIEGLVPLELATSLIHTDDRALVEAMMEAAMRRVGRYELEFRIVRPDGEQRWVLDRGATLGPIGPDGLAQRIMGTVIDITERKATEDRLHAADEAALKNAQQFQALADNMPALCWMAYADGAIYWYNRRWYEYTGTTLESQEGWGWEKVHHPDHIERVVDRWTQSLKTGEPFEMTFPMLSANGTFRSFLTRVAPIRDDQGVIVRWFGTNVDVTEQERLRDHQQLLIHELNHRVKNTLTTVLSLASQSLRTAPDAATAFTRFEERLHGLSRAHDILTREDWQGADLRDIAERALTPFGIPRERVMIDGGSVWLPPQSSLALSMALHELATNAMKYGALSEPGGRIALTWRFAAETGALAFEWRECGGPEVKPPTRSGFGSRLIQRGLNRDLQGHAQLDFEPTGVVCRMSAIVPQGRERAAIFPAALGA